MLLQFIVLTQYDSDCWLCWLLLTLQYPFWVLLPVGWNILRTWASLQVA